MTGHPQHSTNRRPTASEIAKAMTDGLLKLSERARLEKLHLTQSSDPAATQQPSTKEAA